METSVETGNNISIISYIVVITITAIVVRFPQIRP